VHFVRTMVATPTETPSNSIYSTVMKRLKLEMRRTRSRTIDKALGSNKSNRTLPATSRCSRKQSRPYSELVLESILHQKRIQIICQAKVKTQAVTPRRAFSIRSWLARRSTPSLTIYHLIQPRRQLATRTSA